MGFGTFYKCKVIYKPDVRVSDDHTYHYEMQKIYNTIIAAVSGGPSMIRTKDNVDIISNKKSDGELCVEFINDKILNFSSLIENYIVCGQINELNKEDIKKNEDGLLEAVIDGYIDDKDKDDIEYELESNENIIDMIKSELVAAIAMPSMNQKDNDDNIIPWPDWCAAFVREKLDSLRDYRAETILYRQCIDAMRDFPDSVKSC